MFWQTENLNDHKWTAVMWLADMSYQVMTFINSLSKVLIFFKFYECFLYITEPHWMIYQY